MFLNSRKFEMSESREISTLNSEQVVNGDYICSRWHWNCHLGNESWSVTLSLSKCQGDGGHCIKINKLICLEGSKRDPVLSEGENSENTIIFVISALCKLTVRLQCVVWSWGR